MVEQVTDMCSFYHLPSTVIGHAKHRTLNAAYSFYNVATTVRKDAVSSACAVLSDGYRYDILKKFDNIGLSNVFYISDSIERGFAFHPLASSPHRFC